ncbi:MULTISPECIES: group 1 truncated hemoglobin [unclassified Arenimonas]|uniref:group I truncated hemoglobin n=1 Tax=unclassified Arenimonas TaxID=2641713 RepID=UPI000A769ED7|nr:MULTISPECIES: group 1 truncated hemoglobin [unclassified Arenimonas]
MNKTKLLVLCCLLALAGASFAQTTPEEQAMLEEEARLAAEEAALDAAAERDPSAPDPAPAHPELRPVLEAFGGREGLDRLMDTFMAGLLADERMGPFFANADQERVKRQLAEQFCVILGGDCTYSGRDMKSSHAGLGIDRADFNRLVEVLQVAMDAHDVPFSAQNKLLAKLAPMHREVVTE